MSKVAVIGDGGWGTAIAILLASKGTDTVLWSVSEEYALTLDAKRENEKFLKGIPLPDSLEITSDEKACAQVDDVVFAVPCEYLRSVLDRFRGAGFKNVISATKGIEIDSLKRPSEILGEYFPKADITVLSGPSISYEVARGFPTTVVAASASEARKNVQEILMAKTFRVYTSSDVVGVELGGALKNVIAISAGISDGLGFGANSKAAILTRGLAEITRLGLAMGAKAQTFRGLSGIGDLATTCISSHSRNRWFGEEIGKGRKPEDLLGETEMVVEGRGTCASSYQLAKKHGIEMPITQKVYEVLYEGKDAAVAVKELMGREAKEEDYE